MKAFAITIFMLTAAASILAQTEEDVPPPVPVEPVETVFTVQPVVPKDPPQVVLNSLNDPVALRAVVARMSVGQLLQAISQLSANPNGLAAVVAQMNVGQLLQVIGRLSNPSGLSAVVARMSTGQILQVSAKVSPQQAQAIQIPLFLADDPVAWTRLRDWLSIKDSDWVQSYNWVSAARSNFKTRIKREGYTPAIRAEIETFLQKINEKLKH